MLFVAYQHITDLLKTVFSLSQREKELETKYSQFRQCLFSGVFRRKANNFLHLIMSGKLI
ncbi:MAG: hypothetical protein DRQ44_02735 [Gammaproteobacteria bacterium]|nr:MAG: hypothetical protein DRQ44_02735 [Gammaproteobacteria bacterium]